jgi:hypothetical protein
MLDDLYHDIVAKMVDAIEGEGTSHTKLIIIPSLTDATHDFVYPQAPNPVVDSEVSEEDVLGEVVVGHDMCVSSHPFSPPPTPWPSDTARLFLSQPVHIYDSRADLWVHDCRCPQRRV